ncbi:MAG: DUF2795 domain-containing protein [Thermoleophilia bacterium]
MDPIEVQRRLRGMSYPATLDDVLEKAEENGADEELIDDLRSLEQEEFDGPDDLVRALGAAI